MKDKKSPLNAEFLASHVKETSPNNINEAFSNFRNIFISYIRPHHTHFWIN